MFSFFQALELVVAFSAAIYTLYRIAGEIDDLKERVAELEAEVESLVGVVQP